MSDHVSPEKRSAIMSAVRSEDTGPELTVRRALHRLGYRFRLHRRDLPGSPDIVFPARQKVVFVHGCFWHGHDCRWGRLPKTRVEYWREKIEGNRLRDARNYEELEQLGWEYSITWQCELRDLDGALDRLLMFLDE